MGKDPLDGWIMPGEIGPTPAKGGFKDFVDNLDIKKYLPDISEEEIERLKEDALKYEEKVKDTALLIIELSSAMAMQAIASRNAKDDDDDDTDPEPEPPHHEPEPPQE